MTTYYNHQALEKKWQEQWLKSGQNKAEDSPRSQSAKKYILDMFPYPSGEGLHVGHPESYTATDIVARYWRLRGANVLHPMGWDSFGLPAENFAIKTGTHPAESTAKAINNFRRQIKSLGFSYDWTREVNTSSPDYYKWTQWLFLQLYQKGLAYKKKAPVNWCVSCQTVLANEQVADGKCERCASEVIQKDLEQWFFKVTAYAEELLKGMEKLDWPDALKAAQKNWIGKSEGAEIEFKLKGRAEVIKVFTTLPDTIFGATYLVLAPEHELVQSLTLKAQNRKEIEAYINQARSKNSLERTGLAKEKTGVELKGVKAVNPASKKEVPVWIADYVLTGYGTGAIMAVPAGDKRDWDFAKKYKLPIVKVIKSGHNGARQQVQYKIRDWLISRQRYWGAPIPIIYCGQCGPLPVPEKDLPVLLPNDVDFTPTGESPLARSKSFQKAQCPKCGRLARRESDTMDTFVCSSWYFLRYTDPKNAKEAFNKGKIKYWLPVDLYIGGMEHAVGHLIYSRFIYKVLSDLGFLPKSAGSEPFLKIRNQGMILAEDGRKMSKRWHNVINPDDVANEYGADTLRLYEMFMGPLEDAKPWSSKSIIGVRRFLEKVCKFSMNAEFSKTDAGLKKLLHKTIKKVTEDIEAIHFNTAISAMMIFVNEAAVNNISVKDWEKFLIILSPFAPHLSEELWAKLRHAQTIFKEQWPSFDVKLITEDKVKIAVQLNGKLREVIEVEAGINEAMIKEKVLALPKIQFYLKGQVIKKFIYIKDKMASIVV